jgi:hypothetical protein
VQLWHQCWHHYEYKHHKKANGSTINLSAIADASNPTGGFVINGEAAYDWSALITKPPVGLLASAMALKLIALLLALPNTI